MVGLVELFAPWQQGWDAVAFQYLHSVLYVWPSDCVSPVTHRGPPRRPPPHILDQVKALNQSLRLGHLLCRSRNPDFLLHIIQRQVSPALGVLEGARAREVPEVFSIGRVSALGCAVSTVSLSVDGIDIMGPHVCCLPQVDTCPAEGLP